MSSATTSNKDWISVSRVQCALNARGAHLTVDGKWGPNTDAALEAFIGHNFDYGYEYPPDGSAVVRVTGALSAALRCPTTAPARTPSSPAQIVSLPAPFPWGWVALGAAAVATGGFLWWRYA